MSDALADGRRFRIPSANVGVSRERLVPVVDASISGIRLVRELDRIGNMPCYPCVVVSDNSAELTPNAMPTWQEERRVEWRQPSL